MNRIVTGIATALLGMTLLSAPSFADCIHAKNYVPHSGLKGWKTRVANSENADLRAAFANGTCIFIQGAHPGGATPEKALDDLHITVKIAPNTPSCHVFRLKPGYPAGTGFPTTC